ncbi:MAG: TetR/AcrR family transcriptional regulator [Treponema sp.]|jgi:AcrR family transcriptional regulator|nr:TetR/AcrR family transcriptional regulator [Treponema sp.]
MGISERREREKTERRRAILNCAKELILAQGVERVSMEDIAHKAELSKATVYLYFSGKETLLNEISEESARAFLEHLEILLETGLSGIAALKCFWRGYVELFGNSDEIIIIFQVRSFLNSWLPIVLPEEQKKSPHVDAILKAMIGIIDQCKAEGVFDPELDSAKATRLLLSMFSIIVENAARIPPDARKSPAVIEEMTNTFQIIIRGFAKEGIDRSCLDIGIPFFS